MENKLFNSDADRELWIKLNAEHQIEWEKNLTWFNHKTGKHEPTQQALNPRSMKSALEVARNQCEYDEKKGKLRFTLEDLLTLDCEGIDDLYNKSFSEIVKKLGPLR